MRRILQEHNAHWQERLPDVTKPQYAVLRLVAAQPDIEQSAVSAATAIDKATLAVLLLRLEKQGLITRTVDPADRRRRLLRITAAGARRLTAVSRLAERVNSEMLARLTTAERDQLHQLLAKLAQSD